MKKIKVGQILNRVKDAIVIEDGLEYKRLTIRMYHNGVCLRDIELGENIGTKNQFLARSGQFIMSRIDARNGAFGIIPESIGHAAITNDFISFTVNEELVDIDFFELYSRTNNFMQLCIEGSKGTTNRKRLKEEVFLEFEVYLPEIENQIQIVNQVKKSKILKDTLDSELYLQKKAIQNLRQTILQEAVQGKLVPQEPNDESASLLLEKIKAKKQQLIKEKKIKTEKPLPPIAEDEIPYELPQGWEWARLGNIFHFQKGFAFKSVDYKSTGLKIAKVSNLNNITSNSRDYVYIDIESKKLYEQYELQIDDIVITTVGSEPTSPASAVGNVIYIHDDFHGSLLNQNAVRLRVFNLLNSVFLFYTLKSDSFKKYIISVAQGTANQSSITQESIKTFLIGIPPFNEQIRIVERVDQLMALCDELEQTVNQSMQESKILMNSVLQEALNSNKKDKNIVDFPITNSNDTEDWEIAARSDGEIDLETKAKIKNRVTELIGKSKQ